MKDWFLRDYKLKLLSLGVAMVLWVFVHWEERTQLVLRLPIQIVNLPENLLLLNEELPEINVVVEGPKTILQFSKDAFPKVYPVDLKGKKAGTLAVRVDPQRLALPRGTTVAQISPSLITLRLREVSTLRLPVRVRLKGTPKRGYVLKDVWVNPPTIEITALKEELRRLRVIHTEPIFLAGHSQDFTQVVPLDLTGLHIKKITTQEVEVTVKIGPRMVRRVFHRIPVKPIGGPARVTPRRVAVEVEGPEVLMKRLAIREGYVNVETLGPGTYSLAVTFALPPEFRVLSVNPATVRVRKRPPR